MSILSTIATAAVNVLNAIPLGAIVKGAVFVGVAAYTAYVLVKRHKKIVKESEPETAENFSPVEEILKNGPLTSDDAFEDMDEEAQKICKNLRKTPKKKMFKKGKEKKQKNALLSDDDLTEITRIRDLGDDPTVEETIEDLRTTSLFDERIYKMMNEKPKKKKLKPSKKAKEVMSKKKKRKDMNLMEEWKSYGMSVGKSVKEAAASIAVTMGLEDEDEFDPDANISPEVKAAAPYLF